MYIKSKLSETNAVESVRKVGLCTVWLCKCHFLGNPSPNGKKLQCLAWYQTLSI